MPIGIYGTLPHILTNKKLDSKKATINDWQKESLKGAVKMAFVAPSVIAGAGAGATVVVNKFFPKAAQAVRNRLSNLSSMVGSFLSECPVNLDGGITTNLKEMAKQSGIVDFVRNVPAPVKGAAAALAVLLTPVSVYLFEKTKGNMAAAEAKHEVK